MGDNYTILHLHSMLSNAYTTLDAVTNYKDYIKRAKECGMKAMGISEHGHVMNYTYKKWDIEKAGLKYIHAAEAYVTKSRDEKVRDNYHILLISKNLKGFEELNYLLSDRVACNRKDGHFYYVPRITYEELKNTSDNIIISTACLGGILNSNDVDLKKDFVKFLAQNKHRSFLEIQHHQVDQQIEYNKLLYEISKKTGIRLLAGTDTHALNEKHIRGRSVLQKSKNIHFSNEENWDLTFKTYNELVEAYEIQGSLPKKVYMNAINNTNLVADMVEEFELDTDKKYPKLYDNPEKTFKEKIFNSYKNHKYIERHGLEMVKDRINEELEVYKKTESIDFMLLQNYLREWEQENGIKCGYSRGSVSGSYIAYLLGITDMDSIKFGLNFFRFANPERVTNFDIDTDYSKDDREKVMEFLLNNPKWNASEIITFNTIAKKGAIRDVGRAFDMPLSEVDKISKNIDTNEDELRAEYPELFEYVDLLNGVIVSIGTHPAGILVTDRDIQREVGTCTLKTSEYPVSVINMKELDDRFFVKLDILGLDNVGVINKTCKLAELEVRTPDNTDLNDIDVWKSIRDDNTAIFQWESDSAGNYLKEFMSEKTLNIVRNKVPNFNMLKWFSFGNGLIRPACASYRNDVARGEFYDNGLDELNRFLAPTMGHVTMQEDIMNFLVEFCGYSMAESDLVRRGIAKKKGTEKLLPEIKSRFIEFTSKKYNIPKEKCEVIIEPFLSVILDASAYAFSWNHSDSYSCIGYIAGWLRYYYPLEFLTASLNVFQDKEDKTSKLIEYAKKINISINPIKFRYSHAEYTMDKKSKSIYKGIKSIKYMNEIIAGELYQLRENDYDTFTELLVDIIENTSCNSRQLEILIKLGFFEEFGGIKKLISIYSELKDGDNKYKKTYVDKTKVKRIANLKEYEGDIEDEDIPINEKIIYEIEYLGYVKTLDSSMPKDFAVVIDVFSKYKNPIITLYRPNDGTVEKIKVKKYNYDKMTIKQFDIIKTLEKHQARKWKKIDGKFKQIDEKEWILDKWSKVKV